MNDLINQLKFDDKGLIPAIIQDYRTDEVLMMAYMNAESLQKTVETGKAHYYSRSRQKLWLKGETSGHFQYVKSISIDCDNDTLLIKAEQVKAACHTGHRSCFYRKLGIEDLQTNKELNLQTAQEIDIKEIQPDITDKPAAASGQKAAGPEVLQQVFDVIADRLVNPKEGSYTNYLFDKGMDKILKKVGEETAELIIAAKNKTEGEIKYEVADLLYHIMVLLVERGVTLNDIYEELNKRQ